MHSFFVSASVWSLKFRHGAGNGGLNLHRCPSRSCLKTSHQKIFFLLSRVALDAMLFSPEIRQMLLLFPKENVNGKTANDIKRTNLMSITLINSIISNNVVK